MTDLPGITIVLTTEHQLDDFGLMTSIYLAEHQDYPPELMDINIIQAIDGVTLEDARRFGVTKAVTEWVAIMDGTDWAADHLSRFAEVVVQMPYASDVTLPGLGKIWKKNYWLQENT